MNYNFLIKVTQTLLSYDLYNTKDVNILKNRGFL